ncbi:MAG: hypothetical protein E7358_05350 [Clostridiales bacterium]|nr:hypothetical protein [Clostridiales bacterium]
MKKIGITLLLLSIITLTVTAILSANQNSVEYLRIHIRANSNQALDQNVKYQVKNVIVDYLTPIVANCNTKEQMINSINEKKTQLEELANSVLKKAGFNYQSRVLVRNELFPTRVYGDFTLEEGFYDAIIVELGEAKGDNWWCVVYPPLCFTGTENIKYKSKILEIIKSFT